MSSDRTADDGATGSSTANASTSEQQGVTGLLTQLVQALTANKAATKVNHFANVAMNKDDSFPKLYATNQSANVSNRIPAHEGLSWTGNTEAWFSSHGAMGIMQLAKDLIQLDADCKQIKPIFPDQPDWEDLSTSIEGMRAILKKISKTTFGSHVLMPHEDEIQELPNDDVRRSYAQFATVSNQLSYRLRVAATAPSATTTVMHDLFGPSNEALKGKNGEQHSLCGLILLEQIRMKFVNDPQGTSLQMKNKLLSETNAMITSTEFTLYSAETFLHKTDATVTNILSKEPTIKVTLEMEINTAVLAVLRAACRRTKANTRINEELLDAAESISTELTECAKQVRYLSWSKFQASILVILAMHLPTEVVKPDKRDSLQHAVALLTSSGYVQYANKLQNKNGNNQHDDRGKGKSNNDKPSYANDRDEDWTCERCGNKGHRKRSCTNPANPNAAKMVDKAREEKRLARESRLKKFTQRASMTKQGEDLAAQSRSEQATPKRQKHSNGGKSTEVEAGLARIDYEVTIASQNDDDEHEDNSTNGHYRYQGSSRNYYGDAAMEDGSTYAAVLEEAQPEIMQTVFMLLTGIMGIVMAAMTPANHAFQAMGRINLGAILYVVLMSLLQMNIPDLHGSAHRVASTLCAATCMVVMIATYQMLHCGATVLGVFKGNVPNAEKAVYVDSGCTHSVFFTKEKLHNLRAPDREYIIKGVSGQIRVTKVGDFPLSLRDTNGETYTKYVKNCLLAPDAKANLLSAADLGKIGIGFTMQPHKANGKLFMDIPDKGTLFFPLIGVRGLQQLPFYKDTMTCLSGVSTHHLRALTEAEIWHMRMGHASSRKIAKLSMHCKGIPKPLAENSFPCHSCHEAKSEHSDAPPQSTN